jgi:hypothetical protein
VQSRSGPDTVMALMERFPDMVGMNGLTDLTGIAAEWGGLGAAAEAVSIGGTPTFFRGFQGWMDTVVLVETQNVLVGRKPVEDAAGVMVDSLRSIIAENR